jgi:hypothetical protein
MKLNQNEVFFNCKEDEERERKKEEEVSDNFFLENDHNPPGDQPFCQIILAVAGVSDTFSFIIIIITSIITAPLSLFEAKIRSTSSPTLPAC